MESADIYHTDVEMIMDLMKLFLAYDNSKLSDKDKYDILKLQKLIIELFPVAQSNRMSTIYSIVTELYRKNKKDYLEKNITNLNPNQNNTNKEDHLIVLFYRTSCSACKNIMDIWENFKNLNQDSNFIFLEFDSDDSDNDTKRIFSYFNIEYVPTVFKIRYDAISKHDIAKKLDKNITLDTLNNFAIF
jgi:thiol-disulfide isomerase/thioredoxin